MQRIFTTALVAVALTQGAGQTAHAAEVGGFFLKAYGGVSALQGDTFSLSGTQNAVSYDTGSLFGGAVGYGFAGTPFRAELEFTYRSGDVGSLPAAVGSDGDFASTSLMLNGYYMFETSGALQPYVGLGIGALTEIDFDIDSGPALGEYNDRGALAYQVMLGAEYAITDRWAAYGEARYFSAGTAKMSGPGGAVLEADYNTVDLLVGLSLRF